MIINCRLTLEEFLVQQEAAHTHIIVVNTAPGEKCLSALIPITSDVIVELRKLWEAEWHRWHARRDAARDAAAKRRAITWKIKLRLAESNKTQKYPKRITEPEREERYHLYVDARLAGRSMRQAAFDAGYPKNMADHAKSKIEARPEVQKLFAENLKVKVMGAGQ